jgi:tetratricopeptide (TPR) repeat protein
LVTISQRNNPFLLGYKAILTAETRNYEDALKYAQQLEELMKDLQVAKPHAILADIYFKMEDFKKAKIHADKAFAIDPRNLDASRLKEKIDTKLK